MGKNEDLLNPIEVEVAKFAYAGRRNWREAQVDVTRLLHLDAVQEKLCALEDPLDPNAERDAVEAAIEASIERLPDPFKAAAKDHFDFPGTGNVPHNIRARRERAARHFRGGRSERWYRLESDELYGLKPEQYVIALVSAALQGATDPVATIAAERGAPVAKVVSPKPVKRQGFDEIPVAAPPSRQRRLGFFWPQLAAALLGVGATGLILWGSTALSVLQGDDTGKVADVPPRGSVIDAQTGEIVDADSVRPRPDSSGVEWGDIFRACNLTTKACELEGFRGGTETVGARRGDVIDFRVRLHEPYGEPVSLLRLGASSSIEGQHAKVWLYLEWPSRRDDLTGELGLESRHDIADLRVPENSRLTYMPGTTVIYDSPGEESLLARLPDGIMDPGGIKLKDVGAPRNCWNCDLEYVRYVDFKAKVE